MNTGSAESIDVLGAKVEKTRFALGTSIERWFVQTISGTDVVKVKLPAIAARLKLSVQATVGANVDRVRLAAGMSRITLTITVGANVDRTRLPDTGWIVFAL